MNDSRKSTLSAEEEDLFETSLYTLFLDSQVALICPDNILEIFVNKLKQFAFTQLVCTMPKARQRKLPVTSFEPKKPSSNTRQSSRTIIRRLHLLLKRRLNL